MENKNLQAKKYRRWELADAEVKETQRNRLEIVQTSREKISKTKIKKELISLF